MVTSDSTSIGSIPEDADFDDVVHVREWGTLTAYVLPRPPIDHCVIGTISRCALRVHDQSVAVSDVHVQLVRDRSKWVLSELATKSRLRVDGARRTHVILEPGAEIEVGSVTFVAESRRSIELRNLVCRLLGWQRKQLEAVDLALRSIRLAETRRVALVLCGDGDLVPIAQALHRRVLGANRPFVLCNPRRCETSATVRAPENYRDGMFALLTAADGSLCVRTDSLPPHFDEVTAALRQPSSRVQLIACATSIKYRDPFLAVPIFVPPLSARVGELDRIITDYAQDAYFEFEGPRSKVPSYRGLPPADHEWVRQYASSSLPEIEKATLRIVALRASKTVHAAATLLGMAQVSLTRWLTRRNARLHIGSHRARAGLEVGMRDAATPDARVARMTTRPM